MVYQSCEELKIPSLLSVLKPQAGGNLVSGLRCGDYILCIQQPISDSITVYPGDFELLVAFRCRDRTLGEALLERSTFRNY